MATDADQRPAVGYLTHLVTRVGPWPGGVAAWLVSNVIFWLAAQSSGYDYFDVAGHARWDSENYLGIAEHGYHLRQCGPDDWPPMPPGVWWCGNSAWYPLYPALMRALHAVLPWWGLPTVGLLIAEVAALGLFVLLAATLRGLARPGRALAILAVAATLPAGVYFAAIFPMSLVALLLVLGAALLARERWLWAGIAFALAAASYPIGVFGAVMAAGTIGWLVRSRELPWRSGLRALAAAVLPAIGGLVAVFLVSQVTVGRWDASLILEATSAGPNPDHNFLRNFWRLAHEGRGALWPQYQASPRHEFLLTGALLLLVLVALWLARRAGRLTALDVGLGIFGLLVFLGPVALGTNVSQYRSHLLLVPVLLVLRHLPAWVLWPLAVVSVPITYHFSQLFFQSIVI